MSVELVFRDKIADAFCKGEKRILFFKKIKKIESGLKNE